MQNPLAAIRGVAATAALVAGVSVGVPVASAHTHGKKAEKVEHPHRSSSHRHRTHKRHAGHGHGAGHEHGAGHKKHNGHRKHTHNHKKHSHHPKHQPAPTPTPAPAPAPTQPAAVQPAGVGGRWNMVFDDEFNGSAINTSLWSERDGWTNQNDVTDYASNVAESGGTATLTLASSSSGAAIGTNQNVFAVGDFAEARVEFAGSGTTIYNWPAWWVSGPNWPAAGESDVAEGLGTLTVNYHSPSGTHNQGTIPGDWAGAFHTYGIYRGSGYCDVYWDGRLVKHYSTDDNGQAQELIFTMGASNHLQFGTAGQMHVDYVRVWSPA
jgi:hypothetical protein